MQKRYTTFCISFDTPFGWLTLEATTKGLKRIRIGKFCDVEIKLGKNVGVPINRDDYRWVVRLLKKVKNDILDYLRGQVVGAIHKLPLHLDELTPMQIKLLRELKKIKYGETISYKELAECVGTSARACGRLLGSNPFPIIIPCHRVICSDGSLGGYSGGLNLKRKLLKLEHKS